MSENGNFSPNISVLSERKIHDNSTLRQAFIQWQMGNYEEFDKISLDRVDDHDDRATLALLVAAKYLQKGDSEQARHYISLAYSWGCCKEKAKKILTSGVYSTLACAAAVLGNKDKIIEYCTKSIFIFKEEENLRPLIMALARKKLEIFETESFRNHKDIEETSPELISGGKNFSSSEYWESRYAEGGSSGSGSYGKLAEFKAKIINSFIKEKGIRELIEFGCGDGHQASKITVCNYLGLDVSSTIINKCKDKFKEDSSKKFMQVDEFKKNPSTKELTISLDVIFHLTEDDVFEDYMNLLFDSSNKYCIIYSSDEENLDTNAIHVKGRKFTKWIEKHKKNWRLSAIVFNEMPYNKIKINSKSSFSDFYFYENQ